jgi:hypothetical protein
LGLFLKALKFCLFKQGKAGERSNESYQKIEAMCDETIALIVSPITIINYIAYIILHKLFFHTYFFFLYLRDDQAPLSNQVKNLLRDNCPQPLLGQTHSFVPVFAQPHRCQT